MTSLPTIALADLDTVTGGYGPPLQHTEKMNQQNKLGCINRVNKSDLSDEKKEALSFECEKAFLNENFHNFGLSREDRTPGAW